MDASVKVAYATAPQSIEKNVGITERANKIEHALDGVRNRLVQVLQRVSQLENDEGAAGTPKPEMAHAVFALKASEDHIKAIDGLLSRIEVSL